ncbi:MAG: sulfatase [Candidatus Sumerlaeia bacterium]|nr:sulfatase [Candidatus Sumerlaeia bacterium]
MTNTMTGRVPRRTFLRAGSAIGAAVAAAPRVAQSAAPSPRPNILFILSDDHSAPFLGCYGDKVIRTPNLDRLAAEGMRFDRAYTTCPQCVPSRASLMTGRSPVAIAMTRFSAPLPAEVPAWPHLLRENGYFTGVCGRYYHLDGPATEGGVLQEILQRHNLEAFGPRFDRFEKRGSRAETPAWVNKFFDAKPADQPFFLWVNFSDPHRPFDKNALPTPHDPKRLQLPGHFPDTALLREDLAQYYDEIGRLDGDVQRILDILKERGFADNTIIIFMGDNGGALLRGKGTLYEMGCHVPLIVRWPGKVQPGSTTPELISGEDLMPTFLEAAGVPVPNSVTGRSFLNLLLGKPHKGRDYVFTERGAHGQGLPNNSAAFDLGRALTTQTHRFIYNALWQIPFSPVDFGGQPFWKELQQMHAEGKLAPEFSRLYFSPTRPMFELYDLRNDPFEMNNLAGRPEVREIEARLRNALIEWMILERDYLPLPLGAGEPAQAGKKKKKK